MYRPSTALGGSAAVLEDFPPLFEEQVWQRIVHALDLSVRQGQIARLVLSGLTDTQIAARLGLRHTTLRSHLEEMGRRCNSQGRVQLCYRVFQTYLTLAPV